MSDLKIFMDEYFPLGYKWDNVKKYILDSGVLLLDEDVKWLPGYTNISKPKKPHHTNPEKRKWEEDLFLLHDIIHQIWSMDVNCSEKEYVQRQMMGEFLTFYYTEWIIPFERGLIKKDKDYFDERGLYNLMSKVLYLKTSNETLYDLMFRIFINREKVIDSPVFEKISNMFILDMEHSRENYHKLPKGLENRSTFNKSFGAHYYHLDGIFEGFIKNTKKNFDLKLPHNWV